MIFLNEVLTRIAYNDFMMKSLFVSAAILCLFSPFGAALAQEEGSAGPTPIFIKPYTQGSNTYNKTLPTIVTPSANSQAVTTARSTTNKTSSRQGSQRAATKLTPVKDPYAGTLYTRIREEQSYYDTQSQSYMGQYEYMKALSDRGDTAKLNSIRSYLQQNGVFDPAKYKVAMAGGDPNAQSRTNNTSVGGTANITADGRKRVIVPKETGDSSIPKKLHQGYDEQPAPPKNAPIFLR